MIKRLAIIQAVLLGGMGSVFFLPKTPPMKEAALNIELPNWVGDWDGGDDLEPSVKELEILAKDTTFARKNYKRNVPTADIPPTFSGRSPMDVVNLGIVLGGKDPTSSIHALERCLTAQGISIRGSSTLSIPLKSGHLLPVRKLVCEQASGKDSPPAKSIAYYWFVGFDSVTGNHVRRGLRDFSDRLIKGYDQRWAYITVTTHLDPWPINDPGLGEFSRRIITEAQSDKLMNDFLFDIGTEIMRVDDIKDWLTY